MKKLTILLLAVVLFTACERKSKGGQLPPSSQSKEKVVIIKQIGTPLNGNIYRVRFLSTNTLGNVRVDYKYSDNDTIFVSKTQILPQ